MSESQFEHIDATLLYISEARERAENAARAMRRADAEPRLVAAVEAADRELLDLHRRLMETAYFGTPHAQLKLAAQG